MLLFIPILFALSYFNLAKCEDLRIQIKHGLIKGAYRQSLKDRQFVAFTGIPYAKPPINELRFKPPVEVDEWSGTLDATKSRSVCPQINIFFNDFELKGNEDCLYLNVYKPKDVKKPLPVLFFIHGGGFTAGSGDPYMYGPDILLDKDVILVTINYRLGALGFLSTEDNVVRGNNGFKDQNLALKWTKDNIGYFGGNPNKITIFGQSAGGISVHFHVLSPLSKGLFSGAICHSGSALMNISIASEGKARENAFKLGTFLNCSTKTSQELVDCLRKVDAYEIVNQDVQFMEYSYDPLMPFKAVIEPDINGSFITKHPITLIKLKESANVPIMFGLTTEDGAFRVASLYNDYKLIDRFNKEFYYVLPMSLQYKETKSKEEKNFITSSIKKFYFKNEELSDTSRSQLTNFYTDWFFLYPQSLAIRLHAKHTNQPVYNFIFGFRGSISLAPYFGDSNHDYGVCHGDDLIYILSNDAFKSHKFTKSEEKVVDLLTTMWINFADTGNPTPKTDDMIKNIWYPNTNGKDVVSYFIKNDGDAEMVSNMYSDRDDFWTTMFTISQDKSYKTEL